MRWICDYQHERIAAIDDMVKCAGGIGHGKHGLSPIPLGSKVGNLRALIERTHLSLSRI